ncbi:MAG TPA: histidine phosphatase family protein [Campylobacterales bacterium]|nr:histidine phosphatase family protein [Campylobacterales bacterium]
MRGYPTIILLRHGQTEWNLQSRYQGQLDSPLTALGQEQAKANALKVDRNVESLEGIKVFSSPLGRAKSSAHIVCDTLGIDRARILFDSRIQEFSYGLFEGKTKQECRTLYPQEFATREANKWSHQLKNGESYALVTRRLQTWLEEIREEELVIVVAHEMINRALRGLYRGLDNEVTLTLRQANDVVLMLTNKEEHILV